MHTIHHSQPSQILKARIMRRVYVLWAVRVYGPTAAKVGVLLGVVVWSMMRISYAHVFANAPASLPGIVTFFAEAFAHTERTNAILLVAIAIAGLWFLRDLARLLTHHSQHNLHHGTHRHA